MRRLEKIVVGHDLRAGGDTATRSAVELAKRCGAHIKLVHVVEPYPVYQQLSHPFTPPYTTEELVQRAGEQLQVLATTAEHGLTRVEYEVRTGKPFVELILVRRAWQADLIVVGGPTEEQGRFLGSTGERVLRKAIVPVLVAKQSLSAGPKTILLPTDFSASAKKAAEEALALVQHFGGRILFFHAIDIPAAYAVGGYDPLMAPIPPVPPLTPADLKPEWEAFLADLPLRAEVQWDTQTTEGSPVTTITRAAQEQRADLIVMGTHGRTGLAHMLVGSVAEGVVRQAYCPVLTIRPEALQFELP
ncbi:MAG TPA: universal stress protein [Candidatus Binatia bacterium]|jgi:nucleotide-binding universal stress UspA family protein|nr:universal stress protein [Candidatus Binatia bacterium]